jgi:DNA-binding response OmpR family regulator
VKEGLEHTGFEVDCYTNPILALQNFKGGIYQLLVLDIKLPHIDGLDLFNRINKEDDKVKVCFFSASELLNTGFKNLVQHHPDKFLLVSKPISIPTMTKQIKQFLSS